MKRALPYFVLLISLQGLAQQNPCGFDSFRNAQLAKAGAKLEYERANQLLFEDASGQFENAARGGGVRTLPVVVHIVHANGPENISDGLVLDGIAELNLRFRNEAPFYDVNGTDVQIEFCLATVDPSGNATNGITRTVSSNTDIVWTTGPENDEALKNTVRWDPHLYLNLWVIRDIASLNGLVGYSSFPSSLTSYPGVDGIVVQYNFFNNNILAHEVGHYLGLYHTFEGGCTNYNCLLDGDNVCDTPPDGTDDFACPANSCSTDMQDTSGYNPFVVDMEDAPNYMDYTACRISFTAGQSNRMNSALTLLRSELLQSNGCGQNPGAPAPTASFTVIQNCGGTQLTNTSINSVGAAWDYDNDGLIDGYGNALEFNPPSTGYYQVKLFAAGYGGTDTITQTVLAQYYPYQNYPLINGYQGITSSPSGFTACEGATITFLGEPGMAQYTWSNGATTQNNTFVQGTSDFLCFRHYILH
mgnify:FL=1